jgi:hypothetical protein
MKPHICSHLACARPLSTRRFEQTMGANYVRADELIGTCDRAVDVRFGGEVDNAIDGLLADQLCDDIRVANVGFDDAKIRAWKSR